MRIALLITGLLSALVLLFPSIVIVGYFLLVIPGLLLQAMPTFFAYLLAVWLIAMAIPVQTKRTARIIAFAATLVVASAIILPFRYVAIADFEAAQIPDISPSGPIELSGDVLIERNTFFQSAEPPSCDALCMAALDLDAVTSVTINDGFKAATYRLVQNVAEDADLMDQAEPYSPGQIITLTDSAGSQEAIDAYWEQRLSGGEALTRGSALKRADFVLTEVTEWQTESLWVTRAIIRRGDENLLRTSFVRASIPAIPPYIGFYAGGADSGFGSAGFDLGAQTRESGDPLLPGGQDSALASALALKDYSALTDTD